MFFKKIRIVVGYGSSDFIFADFLAAKSVDVIPNYADTSQFTEGVVSTSKTIQPSNNLAIKQSNNTAIQQFNNLTINYLSNIIGQQIKKMSSQIKVFKFGGASLRDVENIQNVAAILRKFSAERIVVVVSAMGKTTNALEDVVRSYFDRDGKAFDLLNGIRQQHEAIMDVLFDKKDDVYALVNDSFVEVEWVLEDEPHDTFDYVYDQIVSLGEIISSKIVAAYLNKLGMKTAWLDARDVLRTNETWREAVVDWDVTIQNAKSIVPPLFTVREDSFVHRTPLEGEGGNLFAITQGFIGSTADNNTTTLGREGSDYSAAIFSHCLDAAGMYIWKDVPGVLNGDPRLFKNLVKLDNISYDEAVEMTYYGATVVHPRTIQPLMVKGIPLHVRSFKDHDAAGTIISAEAPPQYPPIFMAERGQIFLKISNRDFTFLVEPHMRDLFQIFSDYHIFVNLLQNSGAYFFASITHAPDREKELMRDLRAKFAIEEHPNVDLFTIRHPTPEAIADLKTGKRIFYEKTTPDTYQVVLG
jgi:aspartate kinase